MPGRLWPLSWERGSTRSSGSYCRDAQIQLLIVLRAGEAALNTESYVGVALDSGGRPLPNKRLKLTARVDYGMNLSSARRSLSAIR
jgi:hypothetical protein